jgi:hypothetical protein
MLWAPLWKKGFSLSRRFLRDAWNGKGGCSQYRQKKAPLVSSQTRGAFTFFLKAFDLKTYSQLKGQSLYF